MALYVVAVLSAVAAAGPFVWAAITTFKQDSDLYRRRNNPFVYNETPTLDHIELLLDRTAFVTFAWNTLWVGVLVVLITLALSVPAAYSLARLDRPWAGRMGIAIFFVYLVPPTLLFLSLSRIVVALGSAGLHVVAGGRLPDDHDPGLGVAADRVPQDHPADIEEQAMVDGYSRVGAMVRVVAPLLFPGIVAVVVFAFTLTASEFIYALAFISPSAEKVISTGVPTELVRGDVFFWQSLQAADGPRGGPDRARLQPVPRPLHRRLHPGCGEGLTRGPLYRNARLGVHRCTTRRAETDNSRDGGRSGRWWGQRAAATTSARATAVARACSTVGASTITRTSCSVPEGRSSTRPASPS